MNAVVTEDASWMTMDIKDFYLGTPMEVKEYMRIMLDQMPEKSRSKYITKGLVKDGCVLAEISKGIYGLAQAGLLAQNRLVDHLAKNGYLRLSEDHPCLFRHCDGGITFCLVVDDFGVMYKKRKDVDRLLRVLEELYTVKTDWDGSTYIGFSIEHDKKNRIFSLSMPTYIEEAAKRFNIGTPCEELHSPYLEHVRDITVCDSQEKKRIQQIIGVLQYYARAIDPTILTVITKLASEQAKATKGTLKAAEHVIKYALSRPKPTIHFYPSNMKLICYSDASYLTESEGRSRMGGYLFLGSGEDTNLLNGPILCTSSIIDVVVSSAAESEYAAAYNNAREAAYIRLTLEALGYCQGSTPVITDNSFVNAVTNGECKQRRSKAMDMRFNWLRDRVKQGQFEVSWCRGKHNIADYFTKELPPEHFKQLRKHVLPEKSKRVNSIDLFPKKEPNEKNNEQREEGVLISPD